MISTCFTVTVAPTHLETPHVTHLVFGLSECRGLLERLADIISAHQETYRDHLSLRVYSWAASVYEVAAQHHTEAEIEVIARKKIHELFHSILVNPLCPKKPLQVPVLVRNDTWEESTLKIYTNLHPRSYDGELFEDSAPVPHILARDLIVLRRDLLGEVTQEASSVISTATSCSVLAFPTGTRPVFTEEERYTTLMAVPRGEEMLRNSYFMLALDAMGRKQAEQHEMIMAQMRSEYLESMQKMKDMMRTIISQAKEKSAEHDKELLRIWSSVNETHRLATTALRDQIATMDEAHSATIGSLTSRLQEESSIYTQTATTLRQQIQERDLAHQRSIQEFRADIENLNQIHAASVSFLQAQISSAVAEVRSAKAGTDAALAEAEVAKAEVSGLRSQVHNLHCETDALRRKVKTAKEKQCSIL